MTHSANFRLVEHLADSLKRHSIPEKKIGMEAYMRNQFVYFGVQTPVRRELVRKIIQSYQWQDSLQFLDLIMLMWNRNEREFKYVALDLSRRYLKRLDLTCIPFYENLIAEESWWDTVDGIAPQIIGQLIKGKANLVCEFGDKWIADSNFWYQRSALILQLMYRDHTDFESLKKWILLRADSKEFFVQKASGWALRQYAKVNPHKVKTFILHHPELSALTKREGMKHLS